MRSKNTNINIFCIAGRQNCIALEGGRRSTISEVDRWLLHRAFYIVHCVLQQGGRIAGRSRSTSTATAVAMDLSYRCLLRFVLCIAVHGGRIAGKYNFSSSSGWMAFAVYLAFCILHCALQQDIVHCSVYCNSEVELQEKYKCSSSSGQMASSFLTDRCCISLFRKCISILITRMMRIFMKNLMRIFSKLDSSSYIHVNVWRSNYM